VSSLAEVGLPVCCKLSQLHFC